MSESDPPPLRDITAHLEAIEAMLDELLALVKRFVGEDAGGRGLGH